MPSISVITPTCGRKTLSRTLDSLLLSGFTPRDEVLVTGDGPQPVARAICKQYQTKLNVVYQETPVTHDVGGSQRNAGLKIAKGDLLAFLDDDDVFFPRSLNSIREEADKNPKTGLFIFRVHLWWWGNRIIWETPGKLKIGNINGTGLILRNVPGKVPRWTPRYEGDFDFAVESSRLWNGKIKWCEQVTVLQKPPTDDWKNVF